jgi:hypothetical protein
MHRSHWRTLFDLVDDTFQMIAFGTMKGVFRAPRFVELNDDKYHWLTARGTYRAIDRLWYHRDATPACQWLPGFLAAVASRIATWGQRQLPRFRRKHYRTPSHRRLEDRSAAGDGTVYAAIEQITIEHDQICENPGHIVGIVVQDGAGGASIQLGANFSASRMVMRGSSASRNNTIRVFNFAQTHACNYG